MPMPAATKTETRRLTILLLLAALFFGMSGAYACSRASDSQDTRRGTLLPLNSEDRARRRSLD